MILCIRLDTIGDVLMATPAIRALKQSRADRCITLLTSTRGAEVAPLIPEVDRVISFDAPWMKVSSVRADANGDYEVIQRLRAEEFEAAVIFTTYTQSPLPAALLCHLAGIPLRLAHCRENPYRLLTDWLREPEPEQRVRHEVQRQLDLVAEIGCFTNDPRLSIALRGDARAALTQLLCELGVDEDKPWAVIHPGATAESRRYPWHGFAEAAERLVQELGWQVFFTGDKSEIELVDQIQAAMSPSVVSLAGRLSLAQFAALIAEAPLLISNNTGAVHIAAAVGTPVVALYALTNPQHTPWGVPNRVLSHDVPCKYCYSSVCPESHHNCLRLVSPDAVVAAARELMDGGAPRVLAEVPSGAGVGGN